MSEITLRQLEIFRLCASAGSFRRCAETLGISPVGVSQHIRNLESGLGITLFTRTVGGPVSLTEIGKAALAHTEIILSELTELRSLGAGTGDTGRRPVIVTGFPYILLNLLGPIDDLADKYPMFALDIRLESLSPQAIEQRIATGDLEAGFYYSSDRGGPGLFVAEQPLAVYVNQNHPLAQESEVSPERLSQFGLAGFLADNYIEQLIADALTRSGVTVKTRIESSEYGAILHSIRTTGCFGCMFAPVGTMEGLVAVDLAQPLPPLHMRMLAAPGRIDGSAIKNLLYELQRRIRQASLAMR